MDISTVIETKHQCESEIKAMLKMFERQTGCTVGDILIEVVKALGKNSEIVNIHLDVRIDNER